MVLRRLLAVLLGVLFIVLAIAALLLLRVNGTFLEDDFYVTQIRKADVFNFLYDDVAPLAIDEVRDETQELEIDIAKVSPELVAALREAFPPQWLQEQTELAVRAILPYLVGDADDFRIVIPLADRVRAAGPSLKRALSDGKLVDLLYEDVVAVEVKAALEQQGAIPFGLDVTQDQLEAVVRRIAPPDWLRAQIERAIDALLPYLAGDTDRFTVTIGVSDRVEVAGEELKGLLAQWDARDFLFQEVIDPVLRQNIGDAFVVPFNLVVTSQDVQGIVREVVTEPWLDARTKELIDATVAFLIAKSDSFTFVVPLKDREELAVAEVGRLMDERLAQRYESTRQCTPGELASLDLRLFVDRGIACRPPGVTLDQVKGQVGLADYPGRVAQLVAGAVPDSFSFTEGDLRRALGPEQSERLDDIRQWVRQGFAFTHADLEEALARGDYQGVAPWDALDAAGRGRAVAESGNVKVLGDARRRIHEGLVYTQDDLQEWLAERDGGQALDDFERGRTWLGRARSLSIAGWLLPGAFLMSVGILGGRRLSAKLAWAALFLAIPSAVMFAAAGPVYDKVAAPAIQEAFDDALLDPQVERTPLEQAGLRKANAVALDVGDDFLSGLVQRAMLLLIVAAVTLGVTLIWQRMGKSRAPPRSQLGRS